mmetsp:Transcript_11814/g.16259  ORF Transcript_11814/g.16259 Transcript_11814/m.16259 type:complete len:247 (+) Transcript_11814:1784-2524(+)
MMYFIMVLLMKVTWKVISTLTLLGPTALTVMTSSTLKVSAAGTSSSLVQEHTMAPLSSNRFIRCTLTPRVEARPGRFTGLKNFISRPSPRAGDSSAQGDSTRLVSFTDSWYLLMLKGALSCRKSATKSLKAMSSWSEVTGSLRRAAWASCCRTAARLGLGSSEAADSLSGWRPDSVSSTSLGFALELRMEPMEVVATLRRRDIRLFKTVLSVTVGAAAVTEGAEGSAVPPFMGLRLPVLWLLLSGK